MPTSLSCPCWSPERVYLLFDFFFVFVIGTQDLTPGSVFRDGWGGIWNAGVQIHVQRKHLTHWIVPLPSLEPFSPLSWRLCLFCFCRRFSTLAQGGGRTEKLILAHPAWHCVLPCGNRDGITRILSPASGPERALAWWPLPTTGSLPGAPDARGVPLTQHFWCWTEAGLGPRAGESRYSSRPSPIACSSLPEAHARSSFACSAGVALCEQGPVGE